MKLTISSSRGRSLILKISEAGEILGLHNCISRSSHEATAEALQRCEITFVRYDDFLRLLARDPQLLFVVAGHLGRECHQAYNLIHNMAVSNCTSERLARLLLDFAGAEVVGDPSRATVGLTHEEIAQMIGASRETVTRLLKEFRTRRLATLKGSKLYILDKGGLERVARADPAPVISAPAPPARIPPQPFAHPVAQRLSAHR